MTLKQTLGVVFQQEDLNFLLTNRLPRRVLTQFMGWFSRLQHPLIRIPSLWLFRLFADDLELAEAKKRSFLSLHDCFIRELKATARPIDPSPRTVVSPCDAVVGASGQVKEEELFQAKGFPYRLPDLLHDPELVRRYANGRYVTLRLKASMYHRFHAPYDCRVDRLTYISGDTWNVNPIALQRVASLYTKNERAIIETTLETGHRLTLVPIAAVLVASMRFTFVDATFHLKYKGPNVIPCGTRLNKGQEMGWFEHGSTIIVFAPEGFESTSNIREGARLRYGEPLFSLPDE